MNAIRRIDEIIEPIENAGRGDEEYGEPSHDDHGIVWKADPELSDEDNASMAVYDLLKREHATMASCSHYCSYVWYHTEPETDWRDGTIRQEAYFVEGSEAFKRAVAVEWVRQGCGRMHLDVAQTTINGV